MEDAEKVLLIKIQGSVEKLHKLDCTLLGNRDEKWILELFFKPAIHRYNLIEWMLKKFEFSIEEEYGPCNSEEEKIKSLGILGENSHDIIKGTAPVQQQLHFWVNFVNILWADYEINTDFSATNFTDEGVALSSEKLRKGTPEAYDAVGACVRMLCEFVNIKHLFDPRLQLLDPDVKKEIDELFSVSSNMSVLPSLQDLKTQVKENPCTNFKQLFEKSKQNKISVDEKSQDFISENELNKLEDEMTKAVLDIKNVASNGFNDVYNDLKPLILQATPEKFKDVGPDFNRNLPPLEQILKIKESVIKLRESDSDFLKVKKELDDLLNQYQFDSKPITDLLKEEK